jgi:hypothetical protein
VTATERELAAEEEATLNAKIQDHLTSGRALGLPTGDVEVLARMLNKRTQLITRLIEALYAHDNGKIAEAVVEQVYGMALGDDDE